MPLAPGNSVSVRSHNIAEMIRAHHPRDQAIAAAYANARRHPSAASGGGIGAYSHGGPVVEKGFLNSDVAGRTDNLAITVPDGAHVIPADVVSVLGQGNSAAGAKHLREAIDHLNAAHYAKGGNVEKKTHGHTPILAAGGEFIVSPNEVRAWGHGDQKRGHDKIDEMIERIRKSGAKRMLKLKGPQK